MSHLTQIGNNSGLHHWENKHPGIFVNYIYFCSLVCNLHPVLGKLLWNRSKSSHWLLFIWSSYISYKNTQFVESYSTSYTQKSGLQQWRYSTSRNIYCWVIYNNEWMHSLFLWCNYKATLKKYLSILGNTCIILVELLPLSICPLYVKLKVCHNSL